MVEETKKRLRIAYIVGAFPSQSETFVTSQIAGVVKRGHDVDIYTTAECTIAHVPELVTKFSLQKRCHRIDPGPRALIAIARIAHALLVHGWRAPVLVWRALANARRHGTSGVFRLLYATLVLAARGAPRYDVIHAQFGPYGILAMQLTELGAFSGPVVTSIRGYDAGKDLQKRPALYGELFQRCAQLMPVSRALAERVIAAGCDSAKVHVHHSGISYRGWHYREREYRLPQRLRLLTVGRLVEKKGIEYALHAVAQLRNGGYDVSYVVIGDGPRYAELTTLAQALGIAAHVRFLGAQSHDVVRMWFGVSHMLLAPSLTAADGDIEGIPNVVKEAMASGLPVVSTVHGGIPELIQDRVSGMLVGERDASGLARAVLWLMEHPQQWSALTRNARRKVDGEFDIERLNDELVDCYWTVAGRAARLPAPAAPQALALMNGAGHVT